MTKPICFRAGFRWIDGLNGIKRNNFIKIPRTNKTNQYEYIAEVCILIDRIIIIARIIIGCEMRLLMESSYFGCMVMVFVTVYFIQYHTLHYCQHQQNVLDQQY